MKPYDDPKDDRAELTQWQIKTKMAELRELQKSLAAAPTPPVPVLQLETHLSDRDVKALSDYLVQVATPPAQEDEPLCPRPVNGKPDSTTMAECILARECGCTVRGHEYAQAKEQEDEPVYLVMDGYSHGWVRSSKHDYDRTPEEDRWLLYTRPADATLTTRVQYREAFQRGAASCDKLRKAAEDLIETFDRSKALEGMYGPCLVIERLRAALESKPTPSDTDKQSPA